MIDETTLEKSAEYIATEFKDAGTCDAYVEHLASVFTEVTPEQWEDFHEWLHVQTKGVVNDRGMREWPLHDLVFMHALSVVAVALAWHAEADAVGTVGHEEIKMVGRRAYHGKLGTTALAEEFGISEPMAEAISVAYALGRAEE